MGASDFFRVSNAISDFLGAVLSSEIARDLSAWAEGIYRLARLDVDSLIRSKSRDAIRRMGLAAWKCLIAPEFLMVDELLAGDAQVGTRTVADILRRPILPTFDPSHPPALIEDPSDPEQGSSVYWAQPQNHSEEVSRSICTSPTSSKIPSEVG